MSPNELARLIAKIDALATAATPGPWRGEPKRIYVNGVGGPIMSYLAGGPESTEGMKVSLGSERLADHELVAELVNAWPDFRPLLIAAVRAA